MESWDYGSKGKGKGKKGRKDQRASSTPNDRGRDHARGEQSKRQSSDVRGNRKRHGSDSRLVSKANEAKFDWKSTDEFPEPLAALTARAPQKHKGLCLPRAQTPTRLDDGRSDGKEPAFSSNIERFKAEELARVEASRLAQIEKESRAAEKKDRLRAEQEEAERKASEEAATLEAERLAQAEADRKAEESARLEAERLSQEAANAAAEEARLEDERLAKEAAERIASEERERLVKEEEARLDAERLAQEEAERKASEENARLETERLAKEEEARLEEERLAQEEAERKASEEKARLETERLAKEEEARLEAERLETERLAEEAAKAEAERQIADEAARRLAQEEAERKEEAARLKAESIAQAEAQRKAGRVAKIQKQKSRADAYVDRVICINEVKRINLCKTAAAILLEDGQSPDPGLITTEYLSKASLVHPLRWEDAETNFADFYEFAPFAFARLTSAYRHYIEGSPWSADERGAMKDGLKGADFATFSEVAQKATQGNDLDQTICGVLEEVLARQQDCMH
mmetsp:Transcript_89180/g.139552  ORF Transcript_89180/g.139552 Transcript_89180/m.139552 type:complete len:522 (+) Transcript_89180:73-1638(+)|eukprot:CAMPEP_0169367106 /NCGR_PEP_ID=MMETSP1017-20121227/33487_1 /TAXON_ID=342587 /ORGANISM="Karlodinium micrum, Strain CCMP2283" /LENGTH=521 /DNA_ID=CAMNT_0009465115 /DNA_START=66 /DNA_END=1631 /DNA_ORIENTATION=+